MSVYHNLQHLATIIGHHEQRKANRLNELLSTMGHDNNDLQDNITQVQVEHVNITRTVASTFSGFSESDLVGGNTVKK